MLSKFIVSAAFGDLISVTGFNNNVIYNADRFDNIKFTDTNLEKVAAVVEGNGCDDFIFNKGTFTRIYTDDTFLRV